MKKLILILFAAFSFGAIKAHFLPENYNSIKPVITIIPINALSDYHIPFKANHYCSYPYWKVKPIPSVQNKLAVTVSPASLRHSKVRIVPSTSSGTINT